MRTYNRDYDKQWGKMMYNFFDYLPTKYKNASKRDWDIRRMIWDFKDGKIMRAMRLKKREVTDKKVLGEILEECDVVRIGAVDEEGMFIVPVNFGYDFDTGEETTPLTNSATLTTLSAEMPEPLRSTETVLSSSALRSMTCLPANSISGNTTLTCTVSLNGTLALEV